MTKELRKVSKKSLDEETYLIDFTVNSHGYPGYENFDFNFLMRWDAMDEVVSQLDDGDDLRTMRAKITGQVLTLDAALQDTVDEILGRGG